MNKVLSILLSLTLIYGSITPSLAQVGNRAVSSVKATEATLRAMQRIAARTASLSVMLPSRYLAAGVIPAAAGKGSLAAKVAKKVQANPNEMKDLAALQFTHKQVLETLHNFREAKSLSHLDIAYFNAFPHFNITRGFEVTNSDRLAALNHYRRAAAFSLDKKHRSGSVNEWGRNMAAISNLGIYGTSTDAELIIPLSQTAPAEFTVYTDIIASRALLSLNATGKLQELAALRTVEGKLPAHWQGIADYAKAHALPVDLPAVAEGTAPALTKEAKHYLQKWNPLNLHHENASVQATEEWLSLREGARAKIISDEAGKVITKEAARPTIQNGLKIDAPAADALTLSATEIPGAAIERSAGEPAAEAQAQPVEAAAAPVNQKSFTAKAKAFLSRFTNPFKVNAANANARRVLSQKYPLPTLLKQIIESPANAAWKEQAFVRLYEQGVLKETIEKLPAETRKKLDDLYKKPDLETLGKNLLSLYEMGIISEGVSRITNAKKQATLLSELDALVSREDWAARAKAAYESTPIIHTTFSGVVPPVPTVDKEEILSTFRPGGWADQSRGKEIAKKGMLYFQNRIPFYYRNSKGQLSSKPVGILSQEQANLYGKFLSSIYMADQPGIYIPQGFVLALDEMGQWKFVMPNGNRAIVESNPKSKKLLEEIQKKGSKQVAVNTQYSTSDLLAMANLLEHNPDLNLELVMNAPDSMNRFLKWLGAYIGLDSAGALTGPFKATLKGLEGLSNMLGNLVGGVGYMSPWAGGLAAGTMTKLGSIRTLQILFTASIIGLGYSLLPTAWGGLGMTGFQSEEALKAIPLALMALPMVTAVFAGSLLGTQMNVFLNYFKDPVARTSAHLGFAETKQWSRLGLVTVTAALGATLGANWSIVVPIALSMAGVSAALLYNTPVFREFKALQAKAKADAAKEQERLASLTPQQRAEEESKKAADAAHKKELEQQISKLYKSLFRSKGEVKDIAFRVKMVYASYAASLMMLGQTSTSLFGSSYGQFLVGGFMFSTAMMRRFATKQVSSNKMTDNQLTGMSLPLLALTGAGLALTPYAGIAGLAALGTLGILHYVATAVPGQLDAARLQNIVSAELSKRKQAVLDYETMTPEQQVAARSTWDEMDQLVFKEPTKEKRLQLLGEIEKSWAGKATRDYSFFNGHGLAGIAVAAGAGYLFADLGPQWTKDFLEHIGSFMGDGNSLQTLNRLVLGYSAGVAGVLSWKNWGLTKDFFSLFGKKKITAETISAGQVRPKDLGLTLETKDRQLVKVRKELAGVESQLVNYGVNSERKLTKHLQSLVRVHNRLAASFTLEKEAGASEMSTALKADFANLQRVLQKYKTLLETSDPSIMLQREFNALTQALCSDGPALTVLRDDIAYMPEGTYQLPEGYAQYEDASQLVAELDQLAGQIMNGSVSKETYRQFISYQTRVNDLFTEYKKTNPADSARVLKQQEKLNAIIRGLKKADAHHNVLELNAGTTSGQDIQELRDVLAGYAE